ncbi:MAG: LacI family transcriptional regulator, partial [Alphaproteobacteria bacterium]|nr:LacI family transcriptional regulator [Alphaproteobacteria bacterium]
TKEKILQTAKQLNYVPNLAARSLVQGKSNLVGLILPDNSPIYSDFPRLFLQQMELKGYQVLTYSANNDVARQEFIIDILQRQKVDGIAISPVPGDYGAIEKIVDFDTPVVIFNRFIKELPVSNVVFNFRKGVSEAIDTLIERGKKHFYQFARQDIYYGKERRDIFYFNLKVHGISYKTSHTIGVYDTFEDAYDKMIQLIDSKKKVDAVFCSSDFTALGVMRACYDKGINIPADISVVGAYNTSLSRFTQPRISSINANFQDLVKSVVDLLLSKLVDGKTAIENTNIETRFIERETT